MQRKIIQVNMKEVAKINKKVEKRCLQCHIKEVADKCMSRIIQHQSRGNSKMLMKKRINHKNILTIINIFQMKVGAN